MDAIGMTPMGVHARLLVALASESHSRLIASTMAALPLR
jgi:hypothetical protein